MNDSRTSLSSEPLARLSKPEFPFQEPEGPPSLGYDIASKKRSIAISALIILVVNGITPAAIYYIFQYGTNVSRSNVINIVEIATTFTLIHWPWRLWQLLRRGGERAPRNRTALTLDSFQWNFLIGIFPVTICCVLAGTKESMRWYMFGPVSLFCIVAMQMVLTWFLARANVRFPFQTSSLPADEPTRPAVYFMVEDVTACDGGGGQAFRERLNLRWQASPSFRKLMETLTLYLGLGFIAQTMLQVAILFATDEKVFVAVSTAVLWGWCGASALWAIHYTKRALREEKLQWTSGYRQHDLRVAV
ncbi:hypothetical protein JB92DRAFT_2796637 [Gautieria morchelliformis]|nr:hypothetical protein JB92DRAFT_2796637 [Gautieria morchelliformis]